MDRFTVSDGTDTATLTGAGRTPDGELTRWRLEVNLADLNTINGATTDRGTTADRERRLLEAATQAVGLRGGGQLEYWVERVDSQDDHVPTSAGFAPTRDLLRLRRQLPALATDLSTRAFTPGDAEAFLTVNNLAFDWHPDQGSMTDADLKARQAETWYDPDGFCSTRSKTTSSASAGPKFTPTKTHPWARSTQSPSIPSTMGRDWAGPSLLPDWPT